MTFSVNSICRKGKKLILKSIRKKIGSEPVFFLAPKPLWIPTLEGQAPFAPFPQADPISFRSQATARFCVRHRHVYFLWSLPIL
jgi:hypothetical protein